MEKKYTFRKIEKKDLVNLSVLLSNESNLEFFNPHKFDTSSLMVLFKNPSFLMMGVFDGERLAGYFFLRFFANKKAFIGRMVSSDYQRLGIAKEMSRILYGITWKMGFKCLTTISEDNKAIFDLHRKEGNVRF
ncbi:MAG: GNAT family N-acetyltransferase [Saprospiraceae bacterium]|nr:GNAT family N-acetyltransferase [Saprospiraceae bacterium]